MASLTQWTWVWVSSRSWWCTGKPGVLQSMGLKESDWASELNWSIVYMYHPNLPIPPPVYDFSFLVYGNIVDLYIDLVSCHTARLIISSTSYFVHYSFTSSFPICKLFVSFYCLLCWLKPLTQCWILDAVDSNILTLFMISEKTYVLTWLNMMLAISFSLIPFIWLKKFPSISNLLVAFFLIGV